ncbi:MAG: PEPxxWA-CTERM sorting domain-containing protein [Sphingomonadaceae bacterium]
MKNLVATAAITAAFALSPLVATPAAAVVTIFEVDLIDSNDGLGAPINEVRFVNIGANATVTGLGWDVLLYADPPSWFSEMVVALGSSSSFYQLFLTPGAGDNSPGFRFYSSGGILDLVGSGLDFSVDADGLLRLEFFESFVDYPNDWDGIWVEGTIAIQHTGNGSGVIPEPGTWAMMIAGFGLVGNALRRRRTAATA